MKASYKTAGFAEFYDLMVESLPPEFEAGRDVRDVYWPLLTELATGAHNLEGASPGTTTVLDLCCGSGRVALQLAEAWAAWDSRPAGATLALAGVDSSDVMLAAARAKQAVEAGRTTRADHDGCSGSAAEASISWHLGDMAAIGAAPSLAHLHGRCSLALLSAGSFHHLLTSADQAACLRGLAACLQQAPAPAYAVLNIFDPTHLQAASGEATVVGPFRRTCLAQEREEAADGGTVWRQRFALERFASEAETAVAQRAPGSGSSNCRSGGTCGAPVWRREEKWCLREVAPAELQQLAEQAGLQVVRRQARWSDGWPGAHGIDKVGSAGCSLEDARIFVMRRAA